MAKQSELEKRLQEASDLHAKGVLNDEEYATRRTAIMSSPTSAVATKKGGFPIFKVGCLGIIVLVVIVVIAAAASSGGDDKKASVTNLTPGAVGTNKGDVHITFAANTFGMIAAEGNDNRKSKVTILQSSDNVASSNQFSKPAAGKKWWGMEVEVENVGTAEVTSLFWKLRDSKDGEHDQAFVAGGGQGLDPLFNLTPGGKTKGWVYFEIDIDSSPKWIRADPNPFLKNDLYFDVK